MYKKLKWRYLDSSAIRRVAYRSSTRELYVEFHHAGMYAYQGVPSDHFYRLIHAESAGQYFNRAIKPGREPRKLTNGDPV